MLLMTPHEVYLQLPRLHREICATRGVSEVHGVITIDDVMQRLRNENRSVIRPIVERAFSISRIVGSHLKAATLVDEDGTRYLSLTQEEADDFGGFDILDEAEKKKPGLRFGRAKAVTQTGIDQTIIGSDVRANKTFMFHGRFHKDWHKHHELPKDHPIDTEKHGQFHPSEFKMEGEGNSKVPVARRVVGGVKAGAVGKITRHGKLTTVHFGDAGEKHFTEDQAAQLLHIDKEKGTATSRTDIGGTTHIFHLGDMPKTHPLHGKSTELRVPYVIHQGARYTYARGHVTATGNRAHDSDYHLTDHGYWSGDKIDVARLRPGVSKRVWDAVNIPVPSEYSKHFSPVEGKLQRRARGKLRGSALTGMMKVVPGGEQHPNQSPHNQDKAARLAHGIAQKYPDWGLGVGLLPSRHDKLSDKKKAGVDMQINREIRGQHKADLTNFNAREIDSPEQPTHTRSNIPRSDKEGRKGYLQKLKGLLATIANPSTKSVNSPSSVKVLSPHVKASAGKVHRTLKRLGMAERIGDDIVRRVMHEFDGGGMATLGGPVQILGEPKGDFRDSYLYAKRKAEYTSRLSKSDVREDKLVEMFMRAAETCETLSREFPAYSPEYIHATMLNEANAWLTSNFDTSNVSPRSASSRLSVL